jgi:class 3 adenylate cyclase/fermentation-respiration switch protein FrsA (DUF1100 family)
VRIAYAVVGSGPPCVWVLSFTGEIEPSWQFGRRLIERYAADFTVIRYDKRGLGLSKHAEVDFSLEARLRDLEAVVADLQLQRFVLRAQSDGCQTAIAYAAKHPDKVEKLVLIGGYASGPRYRALREGLSDALVALLQAERGIALTTLNTMLSGVLPESSNELVNVEDERRDTVIALIQSIQTTDVSGLLPAVTAPALVIHGSQDKTIPLELGRDLASGLPNATLLIYDGDHYPNSQAAIDQVSRGVWQFLGLGSYKQPARAETPPATITVLFTDLVGHTEMMARLGDEQGRAVLREHERITRDVLQAHQGQEIKTMGDGFMAAFSSVTRAVECAVALQRAFAEWNEAAAEPLHVRIGLNAGEPIEDEGDLFGASVIVASRVAAQAGAGEILVPEPVRHLLAGKDFIFADRGEALLKGFEDAVRLFEVRWRE